LRGKRDERREKAGQQGGQGKARGFHGGYLMG
jgi:hypothetical protein